jgi:tRNA (Thr-GGU) A37 N-methylase
VFEPWIPALAGLEQYERVEVLYWLHLSRRDLVLQSPANDGTARGTFSLRSPARPNPIGTAIAQLIRIEGANVPLRGLDCLDGTPLLDLKPDRTLFHTDRTAVTWRFPNRRSVIYRIDPICPGPASETCRSSRRDHSRHHLCPRRSVIVVGRRDWVTFRPSRPMP